MSRCFPYPPPGYLSNEVCGEAVRDPIKLKRGREDTITELENKKRKDKKQRKEKKDKKKNDKSKKELDYMVDTYKQSDNNPILPKGKEEEAERSDLTEEHELPVCSHSFCHSPDSSGRGNKTKEDDTGSITKTHGNILRIRLPLQRHRETEASPSLREDGLSSDSVKAVYEAIAPCREEFHPVASNSEVAPCREEFHPVASNAEVGLGATKVKDACAADLKVTHIVCNEEKTDSGFSRNKKQKKVASLYKSLFEDWKPPSLEWDQNIFDDSWLLESKEREVPESKSIKLSQTCHESESLTSSLWPHARYLPEVDVFALPYSVPF